MRGRIGIGSPAFPVLFRNSTIPQVFPIRYSFFFLLHIIVIPTQNRTGRLCLYSEIQLISKKRKNH